MTETGFTPSAIPIECESCHEVFVGNGNAKRFQIHWDEKHREPACEVCGKTLKDRAALGRHRWMAHKLRGRQAPSEGRQEEPTQQESPNGGGEPGPASPPADFSPSALDETILREPSLSDDLAALEARVAYLEDQYQRLYGMFNIHQRRQDSHANPQPALGVH